MDFSEVGLLGGANGNHCDYLAGHFRESDEAQSLIRQHYANVRVARVDPTAENDIRSDTHIGLDVVFPDEPYRDGILDYTISLELVDARVKQTKKTLYIVYALDAGYSPNFDLRCH